MKRLFLILLISGQISCGDMSDSEQESGGVNFFSHVSQAWGGVSNWLSGNENPVVVTIEDAAEGILDPSQIRLEEGSYSSHRPSYLNVDTTSQWVPGVQTSECVIAMQSDIKNKSYVECEGVDFTTDGASYEPDRGAMDKPKKKGPKYLNRNYLYSVATLGTEAGFRTLAIDASAAGDVISILQSKNGVENTLQIGHLPTESQYTIPTAFGGTAAISSDGSKILVFDPVLGQAQRWRVEKQLKGLTVECEGIRDIGFKDEAARNAFITMSKDGLAYLLASDRYYTFRHPGAKKERTVNVAKYVGPNERIQGIQMHEKGDFCSILTSRYVYLTSLLNGGHLGFVDLKHHATTCTLRSDAFFSIGMEGGGHTFFDGNSAVKTPSTVYSLSKKPVRSIAMCPQDQIAISADRVGLQIWDMETGEIMSTGPIEGTVEKVEITGRGSGTDEETIVASLTKEGHLDVWIVELWRNLGKRDRLFHSFHEDNAMEPAAQSFLKKVAGNHLLAIQADDARGVIDVRHINVNDLPPKPTEKPVLTSEQKASFRKRLPNNGQQVIAPRVMRGVLPPGGVGEQTRQVVPSNDGCCTIQ